MHTTLKLVKVEDGLNFELKTIPNSLAFQKLVYIVFTGRVVETINHFSRGLHYVMLWPFMNKRLLFGEDVIVQSQIIYSQPDVL